MPIYITLPCKPLVKQYLVNRYGAPVKFPQNDWFRSLMVRFIQRPDTEREAMASIQYYTDSIELPILIREYDRFGNCLTKTSIMHLNQSVQDIIEEALYNYLHLYHKQGQMLLKHAITNFREQYNFPEEAYSTDAIHKFWQRESARRKKVINITAQSVLLIKNTPTKVAIMAKS